MPYRYFRGETHRLSVLVLSGLGPPVQGATVEAKVIRDSDGNHVDWSANSWVSSGGDETLTLTEGGAPGRYGASFDPSVINGTSYPDTYHVVYYHNGSAISTETLRYSRKLEDPGRIL